VEWVRDKWITSIGKTRKEATTFARPGRQKPGTPGGGNRRTLGRSLGCIYNSLCPKRVDSSKDHLVNARITSFNITNFCVSPTQCVCAYRNKRLLFPNPELTGFYNRDVFFYCTVRAESETQNSRCLCLNGNHWLLCFKRENYYLLPYRSTLTDSR
jgi:hypothetical protein